MRVVTEIGALRRKRRPIVLAAGFFDGVHCGHRRVLDETRRRARAVRGEAWVLTFDTHPLKIIKPDAAPRLLTSNVHKVLILRRLRLDGCLLVPFTRALARVEPETFVRRLREAMPTLTEVFVGRNWRFGRDGSGDARMLKRLGRELDFRVSVVRPVVRGGAPVSSTRVREEIQHGRLDSAAALLGRPFTVLGTVMRGRTVGRRLGYPTANLDPHSEVLPPQGVYAVRARVGRGLCRDGVLNFGRRPTFIRTQRRAPVLELHLLDFAADLYGRDIEVAFVGRLRGEKAFRSPAALREQIARDVRDARRLFLAAPHLLP